jgi:hypothetical protein
VGFEPTIPTKATHFECAVYTLPPQELVFRCV